MRYSLLFLLSLVFGATAQAQRFVNLTAREVAVDSVLPRWTYAVPLPEGCDADTYGVELLYPEFIDLTEEEARRCRELTGDAVLPAMPVVERMAVRSRKADQLLLSLTPIVYREGRYRALVSFMLKTDGDGNDSLRLTEGSVAMTTRAGDAASRYAAHSVLSTGRWAKVRVRETGLCRLTEDVIRRAGFTDLSRVRIYGYGGNLVPEKLTGIYLKEYDDLKPVASAMKDGARVFFAKGPVSWEQRDQRSRTRNPYADYGCYLITEGETPADTVDIERIADEWRVSCNRFYSLYEKDEYALFTGGRNLVEKTAADAQAGQCRTVSIAAPRGALKEKGGVLTLSLSAETDMAFTVEMNGTRIGGGTMSLPAYSKATIESFSFDVATMEAENEVTVTPASGGKMRIDYVMLYAREVEDAMPAENLPVQTAEYVCNITQQDHHADTPVDLTIIIPTSQRLRAEAERLKAHHESRDGMTVRVVPADELYNEFSSGTPDVSAYRRYMKMLYDRARTADETPKHLLLMGKCVWDNRLLTAECRKLDADDLLLCYESENSVSETECFVAEDFIALLDDDEALYKKNGTRMVFSGIPDIGIGRIPALTAEEAAVAVDKITAYAENRNAGAWQNTLMFMGDDGNNNIHMSAANGVADIVAQRFPGYDIRKVMWDDFTRVQSATGNRYPDCEDIVKTRQQDGALVMDYCGHGAANSISHEYVLTLADFQGFTNTNLPVWITASCDTSPYDGVEENIGETVVMSGKGGGIAFYGTTRTVFANYNEQINREFVCALLDTMEDGTSMTLGEANRRAKENLVVKQTDLTCNKLQYNLLGDPALRINTPVMRCVVDTINGIAVNGDARTATLHANSRVTVAGHLERGGERVENFAGRIAVTVKDSKELRTCLDNAGEANKPFTYYDRTNTLFTGSDSIRDGRFRFTFVMPRDINYTDESGLMTLFAYGAKDMPTAHGETEAFTVGGSETVFNDSIGPSVFCYLNTPSFMNGGDVNTMPFFVAEIRDNDGINASGAGIGHGMQLVVDNDPGLTFNLNDAFCFDFGSYTSGTTYCCLPELAAGRHTLTFRAWDILNNPSTTRLDFNVVNGLPHDVTSLSVTNNPVRTATTFIIQHNRPAAQPDMTVEILDMSGRLLQTVAAQTVRGSATATADWDVTSGSGQRLETGVYLYRVRSVCDGNVQVSKAKKIIVL